MPLQLVVKGFARDAQILQGRLDIATVTRQRLTYLLRLELLHAGGQAQVLKQQKKKEEKRKKGRKRTKKNTQTEREGKKQTRKITKE
jgi:hypothetical protein